MRAIVVSVNIEVAIILCRGSFCLSYHKYLPLSIWAVWSYVCFHTWVRCFDNQPSCLDLKWEEVRYCQVSLCWLRLIVSENLVTVLFSWQNLKFKSTHWHLISWYNCNLYFPWPKFFKTNRLLYLILVIGILSSFTYWFPVRNELEKQRALLARPQQEIMLWANSIPITWFLAFAFGCPKLPLFPFIVY